MYECIYKVGYSCCHDESDNDLDRKEITTDMNTFLLFKDNTFFYSGMSIDVCFAVGKRYID